MTLVVRTIQIEHEIDKQVVRKQIHVRIRLIVIMILVLIRAIFVLINHLYVPPNLALPFQASTLC
jgi:hypothetical protein